ncbi:transglutaminase family protein [Nocardioides KLBMP 9356]|uniref:Transglutaminase family protein n=1 Tax=Nocardioides potassii TaxID=2911371 RepID=A0ABS9HDA9_9ACTN|nr:transglutaminase family protein [Nocardioides potassii]MCF6379180.1 transglutaminase family protein [Nocardioides potassii]
MELRIVHTTGFEYDGLALASYNQARMTPQTGPGQIVVHTRLGVSPTPWTYDYKDYFGNDVTSFEVLDPHESMTVTAVSTVHTDRAPATLPSLSWEDLKAPEVTDRFTEYLALPQLVAPPTDLAERVRDIAASTSSPGEAAREVCSLVHAEVEYNPGTTDVATPAVEAWAQRGGVCQDIAHLVLGGLRSVGIPARYVSGYLHPLAEARVGETVQGESHAWVEWWDDGWHGFDPTNDLEPGDRWVVVATGRDYLDVRPLHGIYSGAQTSSMFVKVEVTRIA